MASIEEKVEEHFKAILDSLGIRHFGKTEKINDSISNALKAAESKSGNSGNNYPDIQILLDDQHGRRIPVMIEAKGSKGKLEKLDQNGEIEGVTFYKKDGKPGKDGKPIYLKGDSNYSSIIQYAVNGAYHYGKAILKGSDYEEVIIIGINGTTLNSEGKVTDPECKAYYVSKKNKLAPKIIKQFDNRFSLLKQNNIDALLKILNDLNLTEEELEIVKKNAESTLEERVKRIHQALYDDGILKEALTTNEKLYVFCGLIMAGLKTDTLPSLELSDFKSYDNKLENDSKKILNRIAIFLEANNCTLDKIEMIKSLLDPTFNKEVLWKPRNGESIIKNLYKQVKEQIIPCFESDLHLDFTGKILNSLNDWVSIDNDQRHNDVVLTPRYVTSFMAKLARTNKDSFVWDRALGSAGFLVSAMDIMIKDAKDSISDAAELEKKIKDIKEKQLLGIEILGNIYILAILNMILMGDGSSNIINGDSHHLELGQGFPATVFLLNPPYSAAGQGFNFVEEAISQMTTGYACVLIQENAGSGQGLPYTKRILENNTLLASIKMPADLFRGKSSPQTAIYVFKVAKKHDKKKAVLFIDFSNDGYMRMARKKSTQEVNLQDVDDAKGRYSEVIDIVLGNIPETSYYTEKAGTLIKDTISLNGDDWTFNKHIKIDTVPCQEDFKKTVSDYLSWKVSYMAKGTV